MVAGRSRLGTRPRFCLEGRWGAGAEKGGQARRREGGEGLTEDEWAEEGPPEREGEGWGDRIDYRTRTRRRRRQVEKKAYTTQDEEWEEKEGGRRGLVRRENGDEEGDEGARRERGRRGMCGGLLTSSQAHGELGTSPEDCRI
jgi:hypothetical protein